MTKLIDLTGKRFGRLTVVRRASDRVTAVHNPRWECSCDCGHSVIVFRGSLGRDTNSCGCLNRELRQLRAGRKSPSFKHGHALKRVEQKLRPASKEYTAWAYARGSYYRKREIGMCERWNEFENFLADMGPKPSPGHVLSRYDLNDDFTPDNTIWKLRYRRHRRPRRP